MVDSIERSCSRSWCSRTALRRARAVADRWQPHYVATHHLAIALLEEADDGLARLLSRADVEVGQLRAALLRRCDEWAEGHGERPDEATVGGGVPTPKLRASLDACWPHESGGEGRALCAATLFRALLRVPDTFLTQEVGAGRVALLIPPRESGREQG